MPFRILIESYRDTIYYGVVRSFEKQVPSEEFNKLIKPEGFIETGWWFGYKTTSFENGYTRLKNLINEVLKKI